MISMNLLKRLDNALARVEGWLIILILLLMVILIFFQVGLRALFTHLHFQWANALMGDLDWSEPFVRLLVLWLTFLGASLLTKEGKHIKIDLFRTLLPSRWIPVRKFVLALACAFICAVMLKVCIDYLRMEMEFGGVIFLNLPAWSGQLILPAGFALLLFRFLIRAVDQAIQIAGNQKK